jgi:uncharacterized protein
MQLSKPGSKTCEVCGKPTIYRVLRAEQRTWIGEHDFCEQHAKEFHAREYSSDLSETGAERRLDTATRFDIESVLIKSGEWDAFYFLREHGGRRHFSAKIGYCEVVSLYYNLPCSANSQLGTHSAFGRAINALQGTVQDVLIYGFTETEKHFHAFLRIRHVDKLIEVDIRPSDALNLAVVCNVPIFVSEKAWQTYMTSPPETAEPLG